MIEPAPSEGPVSSAIPAGFAVHPASHHALLIHPKGADPFVTSDRGELLYTHTTVSGISVWRGPNLEQIAHGEPAFTWQPDPAVTNATKNIWAPEIHALGDHWYIYYAADDGRNANHRMYVLRSTTRDPLGSYEFCGKIYDPFADRWAIDGTIFHAPTGDLYFIWSGWPGKVNGRQNLYIARMRDPLTLEGPRALLTAPQHPWESWINEGPQILNRSGKTFLVYSANRSWTDHYKLGIMRYHGGDPMKSSSWEKHVDPVFESAVSPEHHGIFAPGHCSFTADPVRGDDWIVYHVARRRGAGWKREVRAQKFRFGADGFPCFGKPQPLRLHAHGLTSA